MKFFSKLVLHLIKQSNNRDKLFKHRINRNFLRFFEDLHLILELRYLGKKILMNYLAKIFYPRATLNIYHYSHNYLKFFPFIIN